ncbi:hypothetical protein QC763_600470 [Podospora pseudopauciseta]|uniref:Heterokaryon incompatibility domain-containing protein n=1 Tax=Podospora pseudopauciseta TaxID=2093780 RepID=A0ABR0H4X7_9PEZI|nr:hypothetical protein QC763_600470 [Podospora pseudopauciseta]
MESEAHAVYRGRPLDLDDSFRLLQLLPGHLDEPVRIRLFSAQLSAAPSYEALSYTWGDPTLTSVIEALSDKGEDEHKPGVEFRSTANCHAALKRLRNPDANRVLWVDSVCINQSHIPERNHQVNLMADIYRAASRVVVYLGESDENSVVVLSWIRELDQPSDFGNGSGALPPSKEAVEGFFRRPWFHRIWVIQEISLAQKAVVVCGKDEVDWGSFTVLYQHNENATRAARLELPYPVTFASRYNKPYRDGAMTYARRLVRMLGRSRHCEATDPRDKLYAIIPLVNIRDGSKTEESWGDVLGISVDYSFSVDRVFTDTAVALLNQQVPLDDVLRHHVPGHEARGLSSWVPDWRIQRENGWRHAKYERIFKGFPGFRGHPVELMFDGVPGIILDKNGTRPAVVGYTDSSTERCPIRVHAINVGNIIKTGPVCSVADDFFPVSNWKQLVEEARRQGSVVPKLERLMEIMIALKLGYPNSVPRGVRLIERYNEQMEKGTCPRKPLRQVIDETASRSGARARHEMDAILSVCDGKRLAITDGGFVAVVPGNAEVDDAVWVLDRVRMPFVCRRTGSGEANVVRLIGASFFFGIMELEAMKEHVSDVRAKAEVMRRVEELVVE